ncbi:Retrovirus-related Pol polyprotein from transposon TNT 1-94, partial [Sesamum angolense]
MPRFDSLSLSLSLSGSPPPPSRLPLSAINGDLLFNSKVGLLARYNEHPISLFLSKSFLNTKSLCGSAFVRTAFVAEVHRLAFVAAFVAFCISDSVFKIPNSGIRAGCVPGSGYSFRSHVGKQVSAKMLWDKLEELYTETSLPSKLFLLEKFFRYKLDMSKNIDENIDEFTKLIQDIKLTGDKNIDDYSPIVLLNAIPETYGDVKAAIKYGRDNVQLETVVSGLKSKEIDLKISKSSQNTSEVNFNVRHVPDLAQNLISCSALEEEGLERKWGKGVMKILKGSLTVFKAERKRNLYVCSVDYDFHAASVVHQNVSDLWHKRHKTTPYTPQQNGVAERMNRTLLNKVRCLLISSGLSKTFWGEALSTAVYLINRSPSVPLLGKIPE